VEYQPAPGTAAASLVNIVGHPVDLRLNGAAGWSRDRLAASLTLSYWGDYRNDLFSPSREVASWLTTDVQLSYRTQQDAGILQGLSVALTVMNLADRDPPAVAFPASTFPPKVGYDSTNASPLGRSISLSLTKRW
jgi:iron complex outermembrane recepter protein